MLLSMEEKTCGLAGCEETFTPRTQNPKQAFCCKEHFNKHRYQQISTHGPRKQYFAFGELKGIYEWSVDPRCRVGLKTLKQRIAKGWDFEAALTIPGRTKGSKTGRHGTLLYDKAGVGKSEHAWSQDPRCVVSRTMLRKRLANGVALDEALTMPASWKPDFTPREAWGRQDSLKGLTRDERCLVPYGVAYRRIQAGWTTENAMEIPVAGVEAEEELQRWLQGWGLEFSKRTRKIISPLELDFYIPDKRFAIEHHGVYWHREVEAGDRNRHYLKWVRCRRLGISLFQIWEDSLLEKPDLVRRMIAHRLGVSSDPVVHARKCEVHLVLKDEADEFYNLNHLQGGVDAKVHLGLHQEEDLVSLCSFSPTGELGEWNLLRFASSCRVTGGFSRLLAGFTRNYDWDTIKTFSDRMISDGDLYAKSGFIPDKEIPPDYQYVVKNRREHKFRYRKKRFLNDPRLVFEKGRTEGELAQMNGFHRVWDAGKIRWVMRREEQ